MTPPSGSDWQRLDPRMLVVYPVRELVRFLPVLLGLFIAGTASGGPGPWWNVAGILVPVGLGVLRYWTTSYRVAAGRVELRRGLLSRHVLSTAVDRVRTVDISAPPVHRLLGLTTVDVGTGTASSDDDERIALDGLPVGRARQLRAELLSSGAAPPVSAPSAPVVVLDPSWARFAPFTTSGLAIAGGVLALANQALSTAGGIGRIDPGRLVRDAETWSPWVSVPTSVASLLVVVSVLSIGGYVVTNWGFRLAHADGAWHLRRGLLTTRETTIDDERLRGVSVGEPLGLRLVGGGWAAAIATGLGRGRSTLLVPPAPRAVVHRAVGAVLRAPGPLDTPLVDHGATARTRRYTRALAPAVLVLLVSVLLVPLADLSVWAPAVVALGIPAAIAVAADRARALGHALVGGYLVVRSGSLNRRREALETDSVIGWNLRATWFQRRSGLTTLVATTAGGRQSVTALDIPEEVAVELARRAHPQLLDPFLAPDGRSS